MAVVEALSASPICQPERWSVSGGSLARRLETWSGILGDTLVAFEMRATTNTPSDFRGVVTRRRFGELALVDCAASACLGHRSTALVDEAERGSCGAVLGVQLVRRGVEVARDRHREIAISAGDVVLWDNRRPVDVEVLEPMHKRMLLLPYQLVAAACPRLAEQTVPPRLADTAAKRLLVRYVNVLAFELASLDVAGQAAAARAAIELLRAAVEPVLPDSRSAIRAAMRDEVRRHIRMNLADPGLTPAAIARAYSISVRALHGLFEDVDESVAGLVRSERLARCMEDLRQPSGGSVTSIAFRWGFGDTAHFSRAFKKAYGITPSEVRQAACERHAEDGEATSSARTELLRREPHARRIEIP